MEICDAADSDDPHRRYAVHRRASRPRTHATHACLYVHPVQSSTCCRIARPATKTRGTSWTAGSPASSSSRARSGLPATDTHPRLTPTRTPPFHHDAYRPGQRVVVVVVVVVVWGPGSPPPFCSPSPPLDLLPANKATVSPCVTLTTLGRFGIECSAVAEGRSGRGRGSAEGCEERPRRATNPDLAHHSAGGTSAPASALKALRTAGPGPGLSL